MDIKPNTQKNFIIARVSVNKSNLVWKKLFSQGDASIIIPMGYSLYYTIGGVLNKYDDNSNIEVKASCVFGQIEKLSKSKDKSQSPNTTLYWIRNNSNYTIKVPWGIVYSESGKGYNGQIKLRVDINNINNFVSGCMCELDAENKDGLTFEYLSEYFVNDKNEQKGLSITIRDYLVAKIEELTNEQENVDDKIKSIKEKNSLEEMQKLLDGLGLTVVEPITGKAFNAEKQNAHESEDE